MAIPKENIMIKDDTFWIGGDDRTASVFEGSLPIPEGVSYNSYVITDEKTCLLDTCDISIAPRFWSGLRSVLGDRGLDYFIIDHMEPDHGACIDQVLETFPHVTVVGTKRTFGMLKNFYNIVPENSIVADGNTVVDLGKHKLSFIEAPMVHWPEVMFTYDSFTRILYTADAFGTFKALSGTLYADETDFDREYLSEARRYYSNIVGKYGSKVQDVFGKISEKDITIDMICPLHGPIWRDNIGYIMEKYMIWSSYEPEEKGTVIAYVSMYGNTAAAAERLAVLLKSKGLKNVTVYDVGRTDPSYVVSDAFRFSNIVFASPTYNGSLHPAMTAVLDAMKIMSVQNRRCCIIGNGSWAPQSQKFIAERLSEMNDMTLICEPMKILSALNSEQYAELDGMAQSIIDSMQ